MQYIDVINIFLCSIDKTQSISFQSIANKRKRVVLTTFTILKRITK